MKKIVVLLSLILAVNILYIYGTTIISRLTPGFSPEISANEETAVGMFVLLLKITAYILASLSNYKIFEALLFPIKKSWIDKCIFGIFSLALPFITNVILLIVTLGDITM